MNKTEYTYPFPRPSVTVDAVILRPITPGEYEVLLIERGKSPFQGQWALPGGFLDMDEDIEAAAVRELEEETKLKITRPLRQIGAFGKVDRDPRGRTITIAYGIILTKEEGQQAVTGSDDAKQAKWHTLQELPPLAFDHQHILEKTLKALNVKKPRP